MIQKQYRLRTSKEIERVFRFGKPFFVDFLGCKVLRAEGDEIKVGFIASKKLFPKAAERNRVKRVLRHAVRETPVFSLSGWHILFFFSKKPEKIEYHHILKDINILIEKIK